MCPHVPYVVHNLLSIFRFTTLTCPHVPYVVQTFPIFFPIKQTTPSPLHQFSRTEPIQF